jgi:hypothetical protein
MWHDTFVYKIFIPLLCPWYLISRLAACPVERRDFFGFGVGITFDSFRVFGKK